MTTTTHLGELAWDRVDDLLQRKVVDGASMTLTRYSFSPGGRFPLHEHDQEQVTIVLSGELTFEVEGMPHVLEEDGVIVIPPGIPHSATAGNSGAEVLSVVSPARTEGRGVRLLEE